MEAVFETVRSVSLLLVTVLAVLIVLAWLAVTRFKIGVKRLEREAEKLSREAEVTCCLRF